MNTFQNKIDRTRFLSQELNNNKKSNDIFKSNKKKTKEKTKREVTFSLTGNIKINSLINPNKLYKDYYIKKITNGLNNNKSSEKTKFER